MHAAAVAPDALRRAVRPPVRGLTPMATTLPSAALNGIPIGPIRTARTRLSRIGISLAGIAAAGIGPSDRAAAAATRSTSPARRPGSGHTTNRSREATRAHTAGLTGNPGPTGTATPAPGSVPARTRARRLTYRRTGADETLAAPLHPTQTGRTAPMTGTAPAATGPGETAPGGTAPGGTAPGGIAPGGTAPAVPEPADGA